MSPPVATQVPGWYVGWVAVLLPTGEPAGMSTHIEVAATAVTAPIGSEHATSAYTSTSEEHVEPSGTPHVHGEQERVSP
jgi:hypothetical protein